MFLDSCHAEEGIWTEWQEDVIVTLVMSSPSRPLRSRIIDHRGNEVSGSLQAGPEYG